MTSVEHFVAYLGRLSDKDLDEHLTLTVAPKHSYPDHVYMARVFTLMLRGMTRGEIDWRKETPLTSAQQ